MSNNSKSALLAWLASGDRMLNCDNIFAISKNKLNALLTQIYISRFNTDSYLDPVNGETPADNGYKVYMHNFILDHPRLSFDNADIDSSRASLRMKIVGGNQVGLKQVGAHWYPQRIDRIEPLVGPELRLRLKMTDVPGYVSADANLILDLRNSDDFVLTFSDSRRIRELGGDFFKTLFKALPESKRIWSLGRIEHGDDELLRPESFLLFTQRNPAVKQSPMEDGDEDVDGAVVGLVSMVAGTGKPDTPGPEYRYLIPDDSDHYSASVFFERMRVALATVIRNLPRDIFQNVEFKIERTPGGGLSAIATAGKLAYQSEVITESYQNETEEGSVHCEAETLMITDEVPIAGRLTINAMADRVTLKLAVDSHEVFTRVQSYRELSYAPAPWINPKFLLGIWKCKTSLNINGEWRVNNINGAKLELSSFDARSGMINDPERLFSFDPESSGSPLDLGHFFFAVLLAYSGQVSLFKSNAFGPIRAALAKDLPSDLRLEEVVENTIKLNFGGAILSREQHMPRDIVCFGHVDPRSTTFTVTPLEKELLHGQKLQLACVPPQSGVEWSVESADGAADAGHFDQNTHGLYLAPGSTAIKGEFTRVRVTATNPYTGFYNSALLTVLKNGLQCSPLLEVCQSGDEGVSLKGDHIAGAELHWRILGSKHFGELPGKTGKTNTYVPYKKKEGEEDKDLEGKSFLIEEVEVSNSLTDERRTLCIVTQMTEKRPADVLVDKRDDTLGRVWLSISAGGQAGVSELTVEHGPGRTGKDQDGKWYYQANAESSAHFCVVRAFWEPAPGFPINFEGFIVLPLPLGAHVNAYQALEQSAQLVRRR